MALQSGPSLHKQNTRKIFVLQKKWMRVLCFQIISPIFKSFKISKLEQSYYPIQYFKAYILTH